MKSWLRRSLIFVQRYQRCPAAPTIPLRPPAQLISFLSSLSRLRSNLGRSDIKALGYGDRRLRVVLNSMVFILFLSMFSISAYAEYTSNPVPVDISVVLSGADIPQVKVYIVKEGDSLAKIAKKHHTTIELIRITNKLTKDMIHPGQKIRVWSKPFTIVVNKSKNILSLKAGDEVVKVYSVATGAGNNTPVGEFTITSRFKNPVWFKKGVAIGPNDPQNALGPRWLGFDKPQYGIHGTIYPDSIGKQASHGCVRMLNKEVIELYDIIPLGTKVLIVD